MDSPEQIRDRPTVSQGQKMKEKKDLVSYRVVEVKKRQVIEFRKITLSFGFTVQG